MTVAVLIGRNIDLDIRVGQQRPTEAAVFVAKKSGGGSTFVSIPINRHFFR